MTRKLFWAHRALKRVEQIGDQISQDSPAATDKGTSRLIFVAENLRIHPAMGRAGRIAGTREIVLSDLPYIIAYRVAENRIEIF